MKGSVASSGAKKLTDNSNGEAKFFREKFGEDWSAAVNHTEFWEKNDRFLFRF